MLIVLTVCNFCVTRPLSCDLHGHDNELVTVYGHVHIKSNEKVLSITSIGISRVVHYEIVDIDSVRGCNPNLLNTGLTGVGDKPPTLAGWPF